ncbi:MAG: helix-turn-helix domain-containing protein [Sedimentitalea sp.]
MTDDDDDILSKLPLRLKEARRKQGLSLESVASLSGVSRSMVSQIERGESSPTIATLWNLTRALQVDFAGLLDAEQSQDQIELMRAGDVPSIDNMGRGVRIRILSPPEDAGTHETYELLLEPGGILDSPPHRRGAREQLTVIAGSVLVRAGAAQIEVKTGETARYRGDLAHAISTRAGRARVFLVVHNA